MVWLNSRLRLWCQCVTNTSGGRSTPCNASGTSLNTPIGEILLGQALDVMRQKKSRAIDASLMMWLLFVVEQSSWRLGGSRHGVRRLMG